MTDTSVFFFLPKGDRIDEIVLEDREIDHLNENKKF